MVPKDRIELSADPYQGPVLPLNYIGKSIKIISKWEKEVNYQSMNMQIFTLVHSNIYIEYIQDIIKYCILKKMGGKTMKPLTIEESMEKYPYLKKMAEYIIFAIPDDIRNLRNGEKVRIRDVKISTEYLKRILQYTYEYGYSVEEDYLNNKQWR